jgi:hypothetical protein
MNQKYTKIQGKGRHFSSSGIWMGLIPAEMTALLFVCFGIIDPARYGNPRQSTSRVGAKPLAAGLQQIICQNS